MTDTLLEQYNQMQTALGHGCSDGYCVIEKTNGMHTNGGCMCLENMNFQDRQRVGHILRIAQKMEARILRDAETIKALTEALKPFAQVPQFGRSGGPLVLAVPGYEDGSEGSDLPRTPTWRGHIPHEAFTRARAAFNAELEKSHG